MEWISVKDKLPDSYGDYLVCGDEWNEMVVATWDTDYWIASIYAQEDSEHYRIKPTYWTNLPEPPQL